MKIWHIISIIVIIGVLGFVTYPIMNENQDIKRENSKLNSDIEILNQKLVKVADTQKRTKAENDQILKKIPLDSEQENLIQDLQKISKRSGFKFNNLKFSKNQNSDFGLPELKVSFSTEGNKKSLRNFLLLIENNERFLSMENLDIQAKEDGRSQSVSFGVSINAFYQQ